MAYLRCHACGAKALEVASTCPTCSHSFDVFSAAGERMALRRCSGCGIMHRRDLQCHWCAKASPSRWRSAAVTRATLGVGLVAFATIGVMRYGAAAQGILARSWSVANVVTTGVPSAASTTHTHSPILAISDAAENTATVDTSNALAVVPSGASVVQDSANAMPIASVAQDSANAMPTLPSVVDSVVSTTMANWVPMVARTWVNVRNDASLRGNVVGVINPASRAMLGETRGGWRQVRSTDVVGWVDPKLFDVDTLRHRG